MLDALYREHYAVLCWRLRRDYPSATDDLVHDAVIEALIAFWHHPDRFDPERRNLARYLTSIARNRLCDQWKRTPQSLPLDEEIAAPGDLADDVASRLLLADLSALVWQAVRDVDERAVARCWLLGERATGQAPSSERLARYRARDRLVRRLRRLSASEAHSASPAPPATGASRQPNRRAA